MATVINTIRLRDMMSGAIDRINDRMRRLERQSRNTANQLQLGFGRIGSSIVVAAESLQLFQSTLQGMRSITDIADQYSQINSRLSLIAEKGQTVADLQNQIYMAAERAQGSYTDMAGGIAKMSLLARDAFKSNAEVIAFTELLQKSYVVGGAAAQEQAAGIYQITQALAAGKLQGDEFRSVMETSPLFAQAIANFTGKSMGELKKMSAEGTISADIMKNAMFKAAEEINDKFSKMPMTFGAAWQIASDKAIRALDPLMKRFTEWINSGGSRQIEDMLNGVAQAALIAANAVFYLSDHWRTISTVLVGVTSALVIYKGATMAATAATWLAKEANQALIISMLRNPYLWVAVALGAVVAATYQFIEASGGLRNAWAITTDFMLYAWDQIQIAALKMGYAILGVFDDINIGVTSAIQYMVNDAIGHINSLISAVNMIPGINVSTIGNATFADDIKNRISGVQANRAANIAQMSKDAAGAANTRRLQREYAQYSNAMKSATGAGAGLAAMNVPTGSPNDPVNTKIKGDVSISEEDLRYMRDLARVKFISKYTTLRPSVQNTFGDVRETADVNKIIGALTDIIDQSTASALR